MELLRPRNRGLSSLTSFIRNNELDTDDNRSLRRRVAPYTQSRLLCREGVWRRLVSMFRLTKMSKCQRPVRQPNKDYLEIFARAPRFESVQTAQFFDEGKPSLRGCTRLTILAGQVLSNKNGLESRRALPLHSFLNKVNCLVCTVLLSSLVE